MSSKPYRRLAAFWRLFRTVPDEHGLGTIRMLVLSVLVGIAAGLGAALLGTLLQFTNWLFMGKVAGVALEGANEYPSWLLGGAQVVLCGAQHEPSPLKLSEITGHIRPLVLLFVPALGGLLSGLLVWRFAPEAAGHGTDSAIEAYHFRGGRVRPVAVPIKTIATSILIGSGGSAGCEGPITQIGGGMGSMIASALGLNIASRRKLMAAGMGAGVGALFHAPLAGALFAAEMLYRDLDLEYEVIIPAIIASVTSTSLYQYIFGFKPLFDTPDNFFSQPKMLLLYIGMAFVISLGARFYTWSFYKVHEAFSRLKLPLWFKPVIGGIVTGIVGIFFLRALGSGYGTIQEALRLTKADTITANSNMFLILLGVFFFKTITTSFSVGSGGSGGIFGPALVVGGSLGGAVGMLFATILPEWNVCVGNFVLVGMVAFFGCAAKTPIATILMVGEMTGNYRLLVPSMWVCILAYLLSRTVSLYRSQLPNRFEAPVHRGSLVSGTLGAFTVKDILDARLESKTVQCVSSGTALSEIVARFSDGRQELFPVLDRKGAISGIIGRVDLSLALSSDPILRQTLLVDDLTLKKHPRVTVDEPLRSVLEKMDDDDAEAVLVVSSGHPQKPLDIITHNDIATAYQSEMAAVR